MSSNSLIISLVLTLLVGASIVYFLNAKIIKLEKSVAHQNTIISECITNIRSEFVGPSVSLASGPVSNDATPEAKLAAESFSRVAPDKINVSDDDSDGESDSESDSENDSENDSDNDSDSEIDGDSVGNKEINANDIKVIDLNSEPKEPAVKENLLNNVAIEETIKTVSLVNVEDEESLKVQSDSDIDSTDNDVQTPPLVNQTPAEEKKYVALQDVEVLPENIPSDLDVHKMFTNNVQPLTSEDNIVSYPKLKVDELRKLAKEGNLGSDDDINKMKKKDLLTLLSK